jgi:hypothetical protein
METHRVLAAALAAAALVSDCGGGGGAYGGGSGGGGGGPTYTIGGTVTGLSSGTLVLQDNGGDNHSITVDGGFTFATSLPYLASYDVTVLTKPVSKSCTVSNGSGVVILSNVTDITVTCVAAAVVQLSEVAPNIAGGQDLVELAVLASGTTKDIVLLQNPVLGGSGTATLATLPDVQVTAGDIIVVHMNDATVTSETSKTGCVSAACFAGAWDFVGGTTGISFTNAVLSVAASDGTTMDAVPFAKPPSTTPATFPTTLQYIQGLGQWQPADSGGMPTDYTTTPSAVDVSVDWSTAGTTPSGNTVQRSGPDTNAKADWSVKASTLGVAN